MLIQALVYFSIFNWPFGRLQLFMATLALLIFVLNINEYVGLDFAMKLMFAIILAGTVLTVAFRKRLAALRSRRSRLIVSICFVLGVLVPCDLTLGPNVIRTQIENVQENVIDSRLRVGMSRDDLYRDLKRIGAEAYSKDGLVEFPPYIPGVAFPGPAGNGKPDVYETFYHYPWFCWVEGTRLTVYFDRTDHVKSWDKKPTIDGYC